MHIPTATIAREQRDGIYEIVRDHLRGIGDVSVSLENEDYAAAEQLAEEFRNDFRLLQDISWKRRGLQPRFSLTMPAEELAEILRRMQAEARKVLSAEALDRQGSEEELEVNRRLRTGYHACEQLLGSLSEDSPRIDF